MSFGCVKVSIFTTLVCLSSPWIPSVRPAGRDGLCNRTCSEDQHVGLAAGKPVPAVFDYCDVCDVNIALERLVSQVVEKNNNNNL